LTGLPSLFTIPRHLVPGVLFDHWAETIEAKYHRRPPPEPPPVLKAVALAKDRDLALSQLLGGYPHLLAVDPESLVDRGELVPRELTPGSEPIPPEE
jgi:hypothetical protein